MAQRNYPENHQGGSENGGRGGHVGVASEKVVLAFAATLATTGVASPVSAQGVETIDMGVTAESPEAMMTRPVGMTYSLDGVTAFPNTLPGNTEIDVVISYTDPEGNPVQKSVLVMTNAEGTGIIFSPGDIPTDRIVPLMYAHTLETSKDFFLPENQVNVAVGASSMNRFKATITFETAGGNVTPHFAYLIFPDGTRVPLSLDGNNGIYTTKFKNPGGNPLPTGSAELVIEGTTQQDLNPTSMAPYTDKKMSFRAQSPVTIDTWATAEVTETQPKENTIPQGWDSYIVDIATPLEADDTVFLKSSDGTVLYRLNFSISGTTLTVYGLGNTSVGEYVISVGTSASNSTDYPLSITPPLTIGVLSGLQRDFDPNTGSFLLYGMKPSAIMTAEGKEVPYSTTMTPEGFWEVTFIGGHPGGGVIPLSIQYGETSSQVQLTIPEASSEPQVSISAAGWCEVGSVMGATTANDTEVYVNGEKLPEGAAIPEEWLVDGMNTVTASMLKSPSDGYVITYEFSKEDLTQKAPEAPEETLPETLDITQVIMPDGTVTLTVSNVKNPGSTIFTFEIEGGGGKIVNNTGIAPQLPQGTKVNITAEKGGKKVSAKVTTDKEVLPAPSALTMAAVTDTIRDFTWSPVEGATGYIVEVNGTPVATPGGNSARITLPEGEDRVVTVRAVKKVGEREIISSSVSLEGITVRVTIPAPTECYVSTNGDGSITATCKTTLYYGKEVTGYEFYIDGKLVKTSEKPSETFPQSAGGKVTVCAVLQDASRTGTQDRFISTHAFAGEVAAYVPPVIPPPAPTVTDLPQEIIIGDGGGTIPENNIGSFTVLNAGNKTITATATLNAPFYGTTQPIVTLTRQGNVFTATLSEFNLAADGTATITIYADGVPIGTYTIEVINAA